MKIRQFFSFILAITIMMSCIMTNSLSAVFAETTEKDYGIVKQSSAGSLFLYLGNDSIVNGSGSIIDGSVNLVSLKITENLKTKDGTAQLRFPAVDLSGKNFNKIDLWAGVGLDAKASNMTASVKVGNTEIASFTDLKKTTNNWDPILFTKDIASTEVNGDVVIDITGDGGNYAGNYAYIRIYNSENADERPVGPNDEGPLPYLNEELSFEERAADLVSRMTLEEKLSQLQYQSAAIDRLGVSSYNYWKEALHGVARQKKATSFPTALSMSNTWNRELIQSMAGIIADEARAKNNRYDLSYWSPTVNMARDPRWGRNEESYGEDPYLAGQIGIAFVKGMQGTEDADNKEGYLKTIATLKHFAANNNEQNRRGGSSKLTEFNFRNYYTRVFQNITEEVMPASFMSSYNATTVYRNNNVLYNYKPSAANSYLLQDVLRRNWGFDGYVTSDCGAGDDLINNKSYHYGLLGNDTSDKGAYLAEAYKNGLNLECYLSGYNASKNDGPEMMQKGYLSEANLDRVVYELFLQRFKTGEFDSNGGKYRKITSDIIENQDHIDKAEEVAEETWVLLENKNNALPLTGEKIISNKSNQNNDIYTINDAAINSETGKVNVDLTYNGSDSEAKAVMLLAVKDVSNKKFKELAVEPITTTNNYSIGTDVTEDDKVELYIWNSLDKMTPLVQSYNVNDNYKVAVVGNFANAALLGDYTGEPTKVTYPIEGIKAAIQEKFPGSEVNLLGSIPDTEKLFNAKSIKLVYENGDKKTLKLSDAQEVQGITVENGIWKDVTPTAKAVFKNVNFQNLASIEVEMAAGTQMGGTLNFAYGSGGPTAATVKSQATANTNTYVVCSGPSSAKDGGYDEIKDMYVTAGATEEFSVEAYKDELDEADVIIAYTGTIPKQSTYGVSGDSDSAESNDRKDIEIPKHQSHVKDICSVDNYASKTILVMSTVGQMNIEEFKDKCAAVLWTSYNGQTQGTALGKVLVGDVNPSGKLTTTWYKNDDIKNMELSNNTDQTVDGIKGKYTDYDIQPHGKDPGHTYQYYKNTPVYPFGYGKSYTTFDYSNMQANKTTVDANEEISFTINVKNSGNKTGKEIVQLYVKHPALNDSNTFDQTFMPSKQLKGFEKIEIPAGENKNVTIKLNIRDMYLFSEKLQKDVVPNGTYTAYIGKDSSDENNKIEFTVTGTLDSKIKTVKAIPDGIVLKGRIDENGENLDTDNEIKPNLSTVMTDEVILFDNSKDNLTVPTGVTIEYTSGNPDIATVTQNNTIVSGSKAGVTKITAKVTYNGEEKTTTFPVVNQLSLKPSTSNINNALAKLKAAYDTYTESDYIAVNWTALQKINSDAQTAINSAQTKDEVDELVNKAIEDFKTIVSKSDFTQAETDINTAYSSLEERKTFYQTDTFAKITKFKTDGLTEIQSIVTKAALETAVARIIENMNSVKLDALTPEKNLYKLSSKNANHIVDGVIDYRTGGIEPYTINTDKYNTVKGTITNNAPNSDIEMQVSNNDGSTISGTPNIIWQIETLGNSKRKVADIDRTTGRLTVYGNGIVRITAIDPDNDKYGTLDVYVNVQIEGEYADDGGGANLADCHKGSGLSEAVDGIGNNVGSSKNYWIKYNSVKLKDLSGISVRYSNKDKDGRVIKVSLSNNDTGVIAQSETLERTSAWDIWNDAALNIDSEALQKAVFDENGCTDIYIQSNDLNFDYFKLTYNNQSTASYSKSSNLKNNKNTVIDSFENSNTEDIDIPIQYANWGNSKIVLTKNNSTGETKIWNIINDTLKTEFNLDYFAEADIDYSKIDLNINYLAEYKDRLYAGCDNGLIVVLTKCVKCYKLKKVSSIDIKSMSISDDTMTISDGTRDIDLNMTDIGGDSIEVDEANVLAANGAIFIDVRSTQEFAQKSFNGSINIPVDNIQDALASYSKDTVLIFYCESGSRASEAIKKAKDIGFTNVYNLGSIDKLI